MRGIHNLANCGLSIRVVFEVLISKPIDLLLRLIADGDDVLLCAEDAFARVVEEGDRLRQIVIDGLHRLDARVDCGGCAVGCGTKPRTAIEDLRASEPPLVEGDSKLSLC
ncbi:MULTISPECIES: hypothetical protein [unclassified Mycobacterium]|uniref:hypothetical protein n=1 Tax=unclassified Mycobacterium TaxID=2642494 RepID=UPI0029C98967|nr:MULTISPECIES: hypothetical protein [unclassified Mycobacterium]